MVFDPEKTRLQLLEPLGIARYSKSNVPEARAYHALHGHVFLMYQDAIRCFIVGLKDEGYTLLRKAKEFTSLAIAEREIPKHYFPHYEEGDRYHTLAQINWLLEDVHDADNLAKAIEELNLYYATLKLNKDSVAPEPYMNARAYKDYMGLFYRAKMKVPQSFTRIGRESTAAYWIARHHLVGDVTQEQLTAAVQALLRRFVPYWMDNYHFQLMARWMKIAYWQPGESAVATLLKCYDFLHCKLPS